MIIRVSKTDVEKEIIEDIKNKVILRINEEPLCIDANHKARTVKDGKDILEINIRDSITIQYVQDDALNYPFNRLIVPIKIEFTSRVVNKLTYRFNNQLNIEEEKNLSFKNEANSLACYQIEKDLSNTGLIKEEKKDKDRIIFEYYPAT
jgi:hypothetical protein